MRGNSTFGYAFLAMGISSLVLFFLAERLLSPGATILPLEATRRMLGGLGSLMTLAGLFRTITARSVCIELTDTQLRVASPFSCCSESKTIPVSEITHVLANVSLMGRYQMPYYNLYFCRIPSPDEDVIKRFCRTRVDLYSGFLWPLSNRGMLPADFAAEAELLGMKMLLSLNLYAVYIWESDISRLIQELQRIRPGLYVAPRGEKG